MAEEFATIVIPKIKAKVLAAPPPPEPRTFAILLTRPIVADGRHLAEGTVVGEIVARYGMAPEYIAGQAARSVRIEQIDKTVEDRNVKRRYTFVLTRFLVVDERRLDEGEVIGEMVCDCNLSPDWMAAHIARTKSNESLERLVCLRAIKG